MSHPCAKCGADKGRSASGNLRCLPCENAERRSKRALNKIERPKVCSKCGAPKTLWASKSRKRWKCHPCIAIEKRDWRRARAAAIGLLPRVSFPGNTQSTIKNRKWNAENKEKRRAHKIVEAAILRGDLKKEPCARCGGEIVHAHHEDYSRPMEVVWLCHADHRARHAELRALDRRVGDDPALPPNASTSHDAHLSAGVVQANVSGAPFLLPPREQTNSESGSQSAATRQSFDL
jgi:ribosomal protein S27AE